MNDTSKTPRPKKPAPRTMMFCCDITGLPLYVVTSDISAIRPLAGRNGGEDAAEINVAGEVYRVRARASDIIKWIE
jgi:hypothetical protein